MSSFKKSRLVRDCDAALQAKRRVTGREMTKTRRGGCGTKGNSEGRVTFLLCPLVPTHQEADWYQCSLAAHLNAIFRSAGTSVQHRPPNYHQLNTALFVDVGICPSQDAQAPSLKKVTRDTPHTPLVFGGMGYFINS